MIQLTGSVDVIHKDIISNVGVENIISADYVTLFNG